VHRAMAGSYRHQTRFAIHSSNSDCTDGISA
jgi:hypothetical protein